MNELLEEVCGYLHNYFIHEIHTGDFSIVNGSIDVDFLQNGQYFRIVGSVFNDCVCQYPADDLHDEEFSGSVWAMAVPPTVIALAGEIEDWIEKYGDTMNSPYQSESFGGYSYSKGSGNSGDSS